MGGEFELAIMWMMDLVQLFLFAGVVLRQRFSKKAVWFIFSVALIAGCYIVSYIFPKNYEIFHLIGSFILFLFLLKGKIIHRFLIFWTEIWFLGYINCFCSVILSFFSQRICYIYLRRYPEVILQNLLSVFVILLFGYIGFRVNKRFFRTLPESFYVTAAAGGMCLYFILMPALELGKQYSNRIFQNFVVLGITLSILLFYIMLIAFYRVNQLRQYYKNESILKEDLLQASKEYCREILENEKEVRKIRHDINDHFTIIDHLVKQERYRELSNYLVEVNGKVENLGQVRRWTGNELLDAMLTRYHAREAFIDFEVESDYSEIGMSNYEICTLFSNAISNAVEACHRLTNTEKKVEIKIKKVRNHSIIVIRNPLEDKLESKSDKSDNKKTTKEDKQNHGFGIEIMQEIIQEKGGSIDFVEKEGWFTLSIVLPLQEEER